MFLKVIFRDLDVFSYIQLGLMFLFVVLSMRHKKQKIDNDNYLLVALLFSFLFHGIFTSEKISTLVIYFSTVVFYYKLLYTKLDYRYFFYPFLILFTVTYILTFEDLYRAFTYSSVNDLFTGLFLNSNTNSFFAICFFSSVLMFLEKGKCRNVLLILSVIYILACGSRNALLFIFLLFAFLYIGNNPRYDPYRFVAFLIVILLLFVYLLVFEMNSEVDFVVFGKEANSAGRAQQIDFVISNFQLNLFGHGKDIVNGTVASEMVYAVHNFYISSVYSTGALAMFLYFVYLKRFYDRLEHNMSKSFLMAVHVYFFFEPGLSFYISFINMVPFILVAHDLKTT